MKELKKIKFGGLKNFCILIFALILIAFLEVLLTYPSYFSYLNEITRKYNLSLNILSFLHIPIFISLMILFGQYNKGIQNLNQSTLILGTIYVATSMHIAASPKYAFNDQLFANMIYVALPAFAIYQISQQNNEINKLHIESIIKSQQFLEQKGFTVKLCTHQTIGLILSAQYNKEKFTILVKTIMPSAHNLKLSQDESEYMEKNPDFLLSIVEPYNFKKQISFFKFEGNTLKEFTPETEKLILTIKKEEQHIINIEKQNKRSLHET